MGKCVSSEHNANQQETRTPKTLRLSQLRVKVGMQTKKPQNDTNMTCSG